MKKKSFLVSLIIIVFTGFFMGCENTREGPSLEFFGGTFINSDVTVDPGGVLKFSWLAAKGSSDLSSFTIQRDGVNLDGYPDESIPNDNYRDSVYLEAPVNAKNYIYNLIVTDKNNLTASGSFTITIE